MTETDVMVRFVKFVVDVKPLGPVCTMAVVIANVVGVITTVCNWNITIVADVIATCN